jgi:hypothetical protein
LLDADLVELGRKGRSYVEANHGWDLVFDRLFRLYREILES